MNSRKRFPSLTVVLFCSLFFLLLLSGCERGNLGLRGGSISGSVLDSRTLAGVQGVNVTASTGEGPESSVKYALTDSRGGYHINGMRAGEWRLSFDKSGYQRIDGEEAAATIRIIVVNNEHRSLPDVRMVQSFQNHHIHIRGILKDSITGNIIHAGNAQFIFGTRTFNNRLPTELQTGFSVPAEVGEMNLTIQVSGYQAYTTVIPSATVDRDLGVVLLDPETYSIKGIWRDVPGWVFQDAPTANIFAYSGNRVVATATSQLNYPSFQLDGIPMGTSVSIDVEVKGYRINGPIPVVPNGDFQGVIHQSFSLRTNFSAIMREVRIVVTGGNISNNDRIGAYCNETGTVWPTTVVSSAGLLTGAPRVIDLGTNSVPTGYTLSFTAYNVGSGNTGVERVMINNDGANPQIVTIRVN